MTDLKPCPLCGANMLPESDGYEHPADDTCPLDSLYIEARHVAAWNTRAATPQPDETAALRAKLAEVERERDGLLRAAHDNHEADMRAQRAEADRDEERKLADDLATWIKAEAEDRGYADGEYPPERQCSGVIARHAARRKE